MKSAISGQGDLAIGNVVSSHIFNIAVILGLAALVCPIPVHRQTLKQDVPIALAVVACWFWCRWIMDEAGLKGRCSSWVSWQHVLNAVLARRQGAPPSNNEMGTESRHWLINLAVDGCVAVGTSRPSINWRLASDISRLERPTHITASRGRRVEHGLAEGLPCELDSSRALKETLNNPRGSLADAARRCADQAKRLLGRRVCTDVGCAASAPMGAPWRRSGLRWRSCKGRRPFTANAALPEHRHEAQRPTGIIQRFLKAVENENAERGEAKLFSRVAMALILAVMASAAAAAEVSTQLGGWDTPLMAAERAASSPNKTGEHPARPNEANPSVYANSLSDEWSAYQARKQVGQALNKAATAKVAMARYYRKNGEWAADNTGYDLPAPERIAADLETVASVDTGMREGHIAVEFSERAYGPLKGRMLVLKGRPTERGIRWACPEALTDIPGKYLPAFCR